MSEAITLAVPNLRVIFGVRSEHSEKLGLTLDGLRSVSHERAVCWKRPLYKTPEALFKHYLMLASGFKRKKGHDVEA